MNLKNKLNIVIIGCGQIAVEKHAPAILSCDKLTLYGCYNPTQSRAQAFSKQFGGKVYNSLEEIWSDAAVDAVDICTLVEAHCSIACAAMQAGKHVLCEKPMTADVAQAQQMVDVSKRCQRNLMIYLNQRLYPGHQKAKELLKAGAIGDIINFRSNLGYDYGDLRYDEQGNFLRKTFRSGALSEMGIHRVDLMMYLLEAHVSEVFSWGATLQKRYPTGEPYDCYDNAVSLLKYENGVVGTLTTSWTVYGGDDRTTKLYGTTGVMTIYGEDNELYIDRPDGTRETFDFGRPMHPQYASRQPRLSYVIPTDVVGAFADSIIGNKPPLISGEEGLEGIRVIDAMYRSAMENRWVTIGVD